MIIYNSFNNEIVSQVKNSAQYEHETDSFLIDGFTVENKLDRIFLYGSLEITKDTAGLEYALKLKRVIDAEIDALKRDKQLPGHIETEASIRK